MSTTTTTYALIKHARGDTPWDVEVNADLDTIDAEIARPRLPFNSPTVGATTTCDLALARVFVFTVSQVTTLAFTNVPSSSFAVTIRLLMTNGGAFALTFPASVSWLPGSVPIFLTSGVDLVELQTIDAGTTWRARLLNGGYARLGAATTAAHVPVVPYTNQSLSTTSTSDASLASYALPANALAVNGQQLRITVTGSTVTQNCTANIKFGATGFGTGFLISANSTFALTILVVRTGAATQRALAWLVTQVVAGAATVQTSRTTPAETLSGAVTVDFRGSVVSGGTLGYDALLVEHLTT